MLSPTRQVCRLQRSKVVSSPQAHVGRGRGHLPAVAKPLVPEPSSSGSNGSDGSGGRKSGDSQPSFDGRDGDGDRDRDRRDRRKVTDSKGWWHAVAWPWLCAVAWPWAWAALNSNLAAVLIASFTALRISENLCGGPKAADLSVGVGLADPKMARLRLEQSGLVAAASKNEGGVSRAGLGVGRGLGAVGLGLGVGLACVGVGVAWGLAGGGRRGGRD